jgi:GxxExxY protein
VILKPAHLGPGHLETIYHAAMEVDLRLKGIKYETKKVIEVSYEGYCIGREEADLVVYGADENEAIVLELKAINDLGAAEAQQLKNYMIGLHVWQGILINFPSLAKNDEAPTPLQFQTYSAMS